MRNNAIFFAALDPTNVPSRNFLNDWFHHVWGAKMGLHFSFCCMIQKGLFIIIFSNPNSQQAIVEKQYWRVGNADFRALPWSLESVNDEILALASPRWITVSNLPPYLWSFVPQILEPFCKVLKMDKSNALIPSSNIRLLFSLGLTPL